MAAYVKYEVFVGDLNGKVHDLLGTAGSSADTCKVMLSNAAPNVATNTVRADVSELSTGGGYTSGGSSIQNVGSRTGGTFTLLGTNVTFTASGGTIGPFEYVIDYNSTASGGPLINYWDYGSHLTLNDGESLTVKFNNGASSGTVYTCA